MSSTATTRAGRPRDTRIDDAVRGAVCELLVEMGYTRLNFEVVAQRAGVSRPALYRRWPTKAHMVHDAVFVAVADDELVPTGGRFEDDLRRMIARTLTSYARPEARVAVPGLLTDLDDPGRRHSVLDALQRPVRAQLAQRMALAAADGEIRPGADPDLLLDMVVGTLLARVVAQGDADPALADRLAFQLLDGLRP